MFPPLVGYKMDGSHGAEITLSTTTLANRASSKEKIVKGNETFLQNPKLIVKIALQNIPNLLGILCQHTPI